MKKISFIFLLLPLSLLAMEKPAVFQLPIEDVDKARVKPAEPLVKTSNVLTEALCSDIQKACAATTDTFQALSAVDELMAIVNGSDTSLFYRLLYIKSFAKHVDALVSNIEQYKNDLSPDSLTYFFKIINTLILSRFSDKMKIFLKEMYVSKCECVETLGTSDDIHAVIGEVGKKIYFLSNRSFLVGFLPNRMDQEQRSVLWEKSEAGTWKSSARSITGKPVPPVPEMGCAVVDLSNRVFKYNQGRTIVGTYIPNDNDYVGLAIVREVDDASTLPTHTWFPLPEFTSRHTRAAEIFKFSHTGGKVAFVFAGTRDAFLDMECYVSTLSYDDPEQQKIRQYSKMPSIRYTEKNGLPPVRIVFSHNDTCVCVVVAGEYCVFFDLSTEAPKKIFTDAVSAVAFTHDDSRLVIATTNNELHCYETKGFTRVWHQNFDKSGKKEKPICYLKFSPDDTLLIALRDSSSQDALVTMFSNPSRERSFEVALKERADANALKKLVPVRSVEVKERLKTALSTINAKLRVDANLRERGKHLEDMQSLHEHQGIPVSLAANKINHITMREKLNKGYIRCLALEGTGRQVMFALSVLEKISERSRMPIHQLFDCIVGTSSAAAVACALVASADGLSPFYKPKEINEFFLSQFAPLFAAKKTKYDTELLQKLCKKLFRDMSFKRAAINLLIPYERVLNTSVNGQQLPRHHQKIFDSEEAIREQQKYVDMSDIAFLSSLDELLFPSYEEILSANSTLHIKGSSVYRYNADLFVEDVFSKEVEKPKIVMLHITPNAGNRDRKKEDTYQFYYCLKPRVDLGLYDSDAYKSEVDSIIQQPSFTTLIQSLTDKP